MAILLRDSHPHGLFRSTRLLTPLGRLAFYGFALTGFFLTLGTSALIALDVLTAPGAGGWPAHVVVVSLFVVFGHLLLEALSRTPAGRVRWTLFALALLDLAWTAWASTRDPVARWVFTASGITGGLWLLGARLLVVHRRSLRPAGMFVQILLAVLGWLWALVLAIILLLR